MPAAPVMAMAPRPDHLRARRRDPSTTMAGPTAGWASSASDARMPVMAARRAVGRLMVTAAAQRVRSNSANPSPRVTPPPSIAHVIGMAAKTTAATPAVRASLSSRANDHAATTAARLQTSGSHRSVLIGSPGTAASTYNPSGGYANGMPPPLYEVRAGRPKPAPRMSSAMVANRPPSPRGNGAMRIGPRRTMAPTATANPARSVPVPYRFRAGDTSRTTQRIIPMATTSVRRLVALWPSDRLTCNDQVGGVVDEEARQGYQHGRRRGEPGEA